MAKTAKTSTEQTAQGTTGNLPEGTHTPESDQEAGAGNSAGPAGLAEAVIAALVERSGCADADHMIDMAAIGLSLMEAIDQAMRGDGPLKGWSPAENPADVIGDLCDRIVDLETRLAFKDVPEDATGKRGFVALSNVRKDNVLIETNSPLWLTLEEHAELVSSLAVDPVWDNGIRT